jgi:hypothetical protein
MIDLPYITPRTHNRNSYVIDFDSYKRFGYTCALLHGMVLRSLTRTPEWIFNTEKRSYAICAARAIEAILAHFNESPEGFMLRSKKDRLQRVRGHICYFLYIGSPYSFEEIARIVGYGAKSTAKDTFDKYVKLMNGSKVHEKEMQEVMALEGVQELHFAKYESTVKERAIRK